MRLRLVTYNIHKCIGGLDRRYQPARIRDTVAHYQPDFVLLQEVDHMAKRSNHDRQVDVLGDMLGLHYRTWFPNVRLPMGGSYGNAILSRFPLLDAQNIDLTVPPRKRRSVLHAHARIHLEGHSRTVHIYNLHLGLSGGERKTQLRRFLESHPFAHLDRKTPIVVAGDFNDVWGTLGPVMLAPAGFRGMPSPLRTFPAYAPLRPLDSVYVRGEVHMLDVHRSRLEVARRASDHLPLIADLEIT